MNGSVQLPVFRVSSGSLQSGNDILAVEEPLEIRLAYGSPDSLITQNLAVTMRTPGNDEELALGFIFTEGIITRDTDIDRIEHVFTDCSENNQNIIQVILKEGFIPNLLHAERNFYTTSSCGVCGKTSIQAIRSVSSFPSESMNCDPIYPGTIISLPDKLAEQQQLFAATGGLHAAALFNNEGNLIFIREDVGRHNALDKLIGASLNTKMLPLTKSILLLSGRASFELVQKAAMAGIPVIAAVGAPSSLAVTLAKEFGITLIGFLRKNRFNIYSGEERIKIPINENSY
ncbi:MAG: formate dehydrogenase accessory sulfurtransferase FdhD [Bacteroidota bacterium]|nr:formate dehydrogenase accessory sulfurtransferase FdhD [Bacteroidota bacterium]